jgi:hypothetical protein
MEVGVHTIAQLLEQLALRTGQSLDLKGFGVMSEKVGGTISQKYLYETLYRKMAKVRYTDVTHLNLQPAKLDEVARFLGYDSFQAFCQRQELYADPVLLACTGTYYCYVRRNDSAGVILRSPCRLYVTDGRVRFELQGPKWHYSGLVSLRHGCLFVLLESAGGKAFHHVYKIGQREKPQVLQGIFSGVSTGFDPIGGRVVLVRATEVYGEMTHDTLEVSRLLKSKDRVEVALAEYFEAYGDNNLQIKRVVTFGVEDLRVS